eukprot:TRINITY_DN56765_c0_g1_i1.p1 TRINITY_DN56765_c0_g1~~TRINITY_DN56765_c0_g1_i1.p1  ORF type:complete len:371 (-),score=49.90 TRINITY_DN56765_c0_g1_i1:91-1203(-)
MRRLVLHFDVNETIMIGDPVSGFDFEASLNNVLAKAAFLSKDGTTWHDGSPLAEESRQDFGDPPALLTDFKMLTEFSQYFERFRSSASRFTNPGSPGSVYRPLYEKLYDKLKWKHESHSVFAPNGHHFLLPAFFHCIRELHRQGREFCIVIRTFGTDLPEVAKCLQAFAQGLHPDFPGAEAGQFHLSEQDAQWVLTRQSRQDANSPIMLRRLNEYMGREGLGSDLSSNGTCGHCEEISSEADIVDFMASRRILGVRDDYHHWKGQGYLPQAGKPLWITVDDEDVQHIFFDDNIHNKSDDSIVAVRARSCKADTFRPISGDATRQLEGILLVKAQPVEAIQDLNYFLNHIARCEENFANMLSKPGSMEALL